MKKMNRFERLLELMMILSDRKKRTVNELAQEMGVSRRTMLRDLQHLSEMGVPLSAVPGPYGGYQLIGTAKLPPIQLHPDEAIGLIVASEGLFQQKSGPFQASALSTVTKVKAAMPKDLLAKVKNISERIALDLPERNIDYPFLDPILKASEEGQVLRILYESRSRTITRDIAPYGIYLADGLWYAVCYCFLRESFVTLRVDRVLSVDLSDRDMPARLTLKQAMEKSSEKEGTRYPCKVAFTQRGCKLVDPHPYFGEKLTMDASGTGWFVDEMLEEDVDWYGRYFMSLGSEAKIHSPEILIDFIKRETQALLEQY
jgi:predicted DNA-binding transcriptional regulator YafY